MIASIIVGYVAVAAGATGLAALFDRSLHDRALGVVLLGAALGCAKAAVFLA